MLWPSQNRWTLTFNTLPILCDNISTLNIVFTKAESIYRVQKKENAKPNVFKSFSLGKNIVLFLEQESIKLFN